MADIGVLPTRTGVQITSSNGENGTIPAATARAAGVMTAAQAQQLDALWAASQTGTGLVVIERPSVPALADGVSRVELRQAVAELQRVIAVNLASGGSDAGLLQRIADLEARQSTLAEIVGRVLDAMEGIGERQQFVEQHAVARVQLGAA